MPLSSDTYWIYWSYRNRINQPRQPTRANPMFAIEYYCAEIERRKAYNQALTKVRRWSYAHAGNSRSAAEKTFAGKQTAVWQDDLVTIRIHRIAGLGTIKDINAISIRAGDTAKDTGYRAQIFAYQGDTKSTPGGQAGFIAGFISEGSGFSPAWNPKQAGRSAMSAIIADTHETPDTAGQECLYITASASPQESTPGFLRISAFSDLIRKDLPLLVTPGHAPPELRNLLAEQRVWSIPGYADPSACLLISRTIDQPEILAQWIQGNVVIAIQETGYCQFITAPQAPAQLAALWQQYKNSKIYAAAQVVATLTEILCHAIQEINDKPRPY